MAPHVVGEYADEHVRFHPVAQMMVDGPGLQVDAFVGAERALDLTEVLVGGTTSAALSFSSG